MVSGDAVDWTMGSESGVDDHAAKFPLFKESEVCTCLASWWADKIGTLGTFSLGATLANITCTDINKC